MNDDSALARLNVRRWPEDAAQQDLVTVEEPLEIRLGWGPLSDRRQQSIAVTMRTPGDDTRLALGFLYGEGIVTDRAQVRSIGPCGETGDDVGQVIRVELQTDVEPDIDRLARHFFTTSSCGVCGKQSLEALRFHTRYAPAESTFTIAAEKLAALPEALDAVQPLFRQAGSIHAAALFGPDGVIDTVCEDVGRHNALDKLIGGALDKDRLPLSDNGILVSGRASFELVQKAVMAGCPLLAAIGGPSSLAIDAAREFGVTLAGFVRAERFNIYSGSERIDR